MVTHHYRAFAVSLVALAGALATHPAYAQDASVTEANANADAKGDTLEEIVVTARKVGESAQSLPITVAAFSGAEIENKVVVSAQDLQAITPGLTVSSSSTGGIPKFSIRGTSTELGIDGGVALYFNDVPLISPVGIMNSFFDVSTVEVLKGPQGTQFGTNTTGGTISIRTNLPTDKFEGYVQGGLGNYSRRELEGVFNVPIADGVGLRLAGNYVKRDGYVKNLAAAGKLPKDFNDENHYALRGTFAIESGIVKNYLIADYFNRDETPRQQLPIRFGPSLLSLDPATMAPTLPQLGAQLATDKYAYVGPNASGIQPELYGRGDLYGIQNRTNVELSDNVSLRNVLGYRNDHTTTSEESCGCNVVNVNVLKDVKASQWTNDLTVRYETTDKRLRASVGGYYSFLRSGTGLNANVLQGIFAGAAFVDPQAATNVVSNGSYETKASRSKAVYINADFDVTETLNLSGGFRYNWDTVRSDVTASLNLLNPANYRSAFGFTFPIGSPPIFGSVFGPDAERPCDANSLIGYPNFNPVSCTASREAQFKAPSWTFVVSNKFSSGVLGYAKVSRGYLAGGTNFTLRDAGRTIYQPEINTMYEAGLKADWRLGDRPIRTNVAVYLGKIKDKQVFANANYDGGGTGFGVVNAARQTVYGVDFDMRYSPFEGMTLDLGYNYIHSKFDEFIYPGLGGPSPQTFVPEAVLSGLTPAQTPSHQLSGALTYAFPTSASTGDITATFAGYYTSEITQANRLSDYDEALAGDLNTTPGYFLANASLNWQNVMSSPVSVRLWVNNLFDKKYLIATNVQIATFGFASGNYGPPRMYGATVKFGF